MNTETGQKARDPRDRGDPGPVRFRTQGLQIRSRIQAKVVSSASREVKPPVP